MAVLLLPAGITELLTRNRIEHSCLDAMDQSDGLALGRNQVVPAAGDVPRRTEPEDTICQRITLMVIEQQPGIKLLALQRFLNAEEVHAIRE